jgi:hypothetical protein
MSYGEIMDIFISEYLDLPPGPPNQTPLCMGDLLWELEADGWVANTHHGEQA